MGALPLFHRLFFSDPTALIFGFVVFIIGQPVSAADVAEAALRATVRVTADGKSGTGFFVTLPATDEQKPRTVLVTAAHVLEDMPGSKCVLVFRATDNEGGFVRKDTDATVKDGDKKMWLRHPVADIAVLGALCRKELMSNRFC